MKTWKLTFAALLAVASFAGSASAITFNELQAGINITINDTIWNSTYSNVNPQAIGQGNEDNETEKTASGANTYALQKWDFEGMFWNNATQKLTLIAGWNFDTGVANGSSKVHVGDLFLGSFGQPAANGSGAPYTANEAISFDRDADGSLMASGAYLKGTSFQTVGTTDVSQSNPYMVDRSRSNNLLNSDLFTYSTGAVTGSPFSSWELSSDTHYFLQISGLTTSEIANDILHITLACGNDAGAGQYAPVPEPSTFVLLGAGLLGAGFIRRRMKK